MASSPGSGVEDLELGRNGIGTSASVGNLFLQVKEASQHSISIPHTSSPLFQGYSRNIPTPESSPP
jgi:hypothetical protein